MSLGPLPQQTGRFFGGKAMNWNERCLKSISKQKKEVQKRYGITIGMTTIYCAKCGENWGYGDHVCRKKGLGRVHKAKKSCPDASCASTGVSMKGIGGKND